MDLLKSPAAILSHELRTPLAAIIGLAEQLSSQCLTPLQQEFVEEISQSGKHLLSVIDDLLKNKALEPGS